MLLAMLYTLDIMFKKRSLKKMRRFFKVCLFVILGSLLSQVLIPATFGGSAKAVSVLNPGDIAIITANSDIGYDPLTPNSNGFDFVSKVDLDAGTEIYFADKGWDGSLAIPFWRNTTGEGALRYTVPVGGISAGTIVRYEDNMIPSLPSSGSSTWDMYSIDPITGATTLSTSIASGFDPSASGDNILVFQGSAAAPNFIFGIGWSAATTWISSGTPSANNSWIPSSLSAASGTIVTLGSTDNYQYQCTNLGMFSSAFSIDLQNISNWNNDNTTPYGPISGCSFDTSRPTATISHLGQADPTNNNSINYTLTFDQAIDPASFTTSDIVLSGTGSGSVNSVTTTDNITWTVNVIAGTEGTITISLPAGSVIDPNGNPNLASIITDDTVTYDTTPPATLAAPDMSSSSDSGQSNSDDITNDSTPEFTGSCDNGDTITILVDGSAITPTAVCASGSYSITPDNPLSEGSHNIQVTATDPAGNLSATSGILSISVDLIAPYCSVNTDLNFDVSPTIEGYADDPSAQVTIQIDGNNYLAINNSGNWVVNSGTISPDLNIGQSYLIDLSCVDLAGNEYTSNQNFDVNRHVDLAVNIKLNTIGKITAGQNVSYNITLTNPDATPFIGLSNLFFYILSPTILDPGINPGDQFPTSNAGIECEYFGNAGSIGDPIWNQYTGNNVFACGFNALTVLNPGETFSFNISYTASSDLPDGLTNRVLIYDENGFDPDSLLLSSIAEEDGDIYGLNSNSVASAIYKIPAPVDTGTNTNTTNTAAPAKELASTGDNYIILILSALLMISGALCAKLLRWKLN